MSFQSKTVIFLSLLLFPFVGIAQSGTGDTVLYEGQTSVPAMADSQATESAPEANNETYNANRPLNTAAPTADEWNKLTADKDFGYKDQKEYAGTKPPEPPKTPGWLKALIKFFAFFATTAGHVVLWTLLALIIGFLIYRLVLGEGGSIFSRNKKVGEAEEGGDEISEDDLLESDWEAKLRASLAAGDNRMAIRYSYLLLLQLLQRRTLINYRQDKTNADYYRELGTTGEKYRPDFRNITRQYEWAWYGAFVGSREEVDTYFQNFNRLKSAIS